MSIPSNNYSTLKSEHQRWITTATFFFLLRDGLDLVSYWSVMWCLHVSCMGIFPCWTCSVPQNNFFLDRRAGMFHLDYCNSNRGRKVKRNIYPHCFGGNKSRGLLEHGGGFGLAAIKIQRERTWLQRNFARRVVLEARFRRLKGSSNQW